MAAGELSALEELLTQLLVRDKPLLSQQVLSQLWPICSRAHQAARGAPQQNPDRAEGATQSPSQAGRDAEVASSALGASEGRDNARKRVVAALAVISMAGAAHPQLIADHLEALLQVNCTPAMAGCQHQACTCVLTVKQLVHHPCPVVHQQHHPGSPEIQILKVNLRFCKIIIDLLMSSTYGASTACLLSYKSGYEMYV